MTAWELGGLTLSIEFAVISWIILFFFMKLRLNKVPVAKRAERKQAELVLQDLSTLERKRRAALTSLFATAYALEGTDLTDKVDEFVAREQAFYRAMVNLYLEREGEWFQEIPLELGKVLAPWVQLTPSRVLAAQQVHELEHENADLIAELADAQQTLDRMMADYMAAFRKHTQDFIQKDEINEIDAIDKIAETESESDFADLLAVNQFNEPESIENIAQETEPEQNQKEIDQFESTIKEIKETKETDEEELEGLDDLFKLESKI